MNLNGKSVLVTGGTGSFGKKFIETVLKLYRPKRLIVLSRDDLKQSDRTTGRITRTRSAIHVTDPGGRTR